MAAPRAWTPADWNKGDLCSLTPLCLASGNHKCVLTIVSINNNHYEVLRGGRQCHKAGRGKIRSRGSQVTRLELGWGFSLPDSLRRRQVALATAEGVSDSLTVRKGWLTLKSALRGVDVKKVKAAELRVSNSPGASRSVSDLIRPARWQLTQSTSGCHFTSFSPDSDISRGTQLHSHVAGHSADEHINAALRGPSVFLSVGVHTHN